MTLVTRFHFLVKSPKNLFLHQVVFTLKKSLDKSSLIHQSFGQFQKKEMCVFEKLLLNKYITKIELQETSKQKHLYVLCIKNGP